MAQMEGEIPTANNTRASISSSRASFISVSVAVDAMRSSSNPHAFMGVTEHGLAAIVKTRGNQDVHVILRGGTKGTNYASEHVKAAAKALEKARPKNHPSIMIDCSRMSSYVCDGTRTHDITRR
jgi:phospho-2-dehydro-3-deoxyheptonate aldolase